MTVQIYGDESGFTGNNLLHKDQPYFVFATVAISAGEADDLVRRVVRDFGVASPELKGQKLLQYARGRKAIAEIFRVLEGRMKTATFEKRYSLAAKFFEYIFEPSLADNNALFYTLKFHLFIANLLHIHFTQKARYAEEIFAEFERFMRSLDESKLIYATSELLYPSRPPALELIAAFTTANISSVRTELESLRGTETGKWILDLTSTALYTLLCEWGETCDAMEVFCDESKPLATNPAMISGMVGRTVKAYHTLFGEKRGVTFNLVKEVEFVRSVNTPGIQLADVVASATRALATTPKDRDWDILRHGVINAMGRCAVVPELEYIDLEQPIVRRNYLILQELVRRSVRREPLLPDMANFAVAATEAVGLTTSDLGAPVFEK